MRKIAIIGASYLQQPLIIRAKEMGLETHVFAWKSGDIGERTADFFYPISIVEKEEIAQKCRAIGVDGIATISTDLGAITVNYVADKLGLVANSPTCTRLSTNKYYMRQAFREHGDPSVKSILVSSIHDLDGVELRYPVIVKPLDRSGSRGITKLQDGVGLEQAIENAKSQGFEKKALVEEFAEGEEYSVEYISYRGQHQFLQITKKYTSGAPHFIETGHLEPAPVSPAMLEKVKKVVVHALDSLNIQYGASHTELKIDSDGNIVLIEIGGRMGGDCIGSDLVQLSTGVDFVGDVIRVAMGEAPGAFESAVVNNGKVAAVRFVFNKSDVELYHELEKAHPEWIVRSEFHQITSDEVLDSSERFGYFIFAGDSLADVEEYLSR